MYVLYMVNFAALTEFFTRLMPTLSTRTRSCVRVLENRTLQKTKRRYTSYHPRHHFDQRTARTREPANSILKVFTMTSPASSHSLFYYSLLLVCFFFNSY